MAKNRFEHVDEPQEDAVTLHLQKGEPEPSAKVICPANLTGGRLAEDTTSAPMPLVEGFRSAVRLANEIRAPIVVVDADGLWVPEWGDLYRAV